jgi:nicotinic acid phosphoribosyltransferase
MRLGPELSSGLLTDLYQLTMAEAYHSAGVTGTEACFHLFFRENPFDGGFSVACGLEQAIGYLEGLHFTPDDIRYLSALRGATVTRSFPGTSSNGFRDSCSRVMWMPCPKEPRSFRESHSCGCEVPLCNVR